MGLFRPLSGSVVFGAVVESCDRRPPAPHLHSAERDGCDHALPHRGEQVSMLMMVAVVVEVVLLVVSLVVVVGVGVGGGAGCGVVCGGWRHSGGCGGSRQRRELL